MIHSQEQFSKVSKFADKQTTGGSEMQICFRTKKAKQDWTKDLVFSYRKAANMNGAVLKIEQVNI